MDTNKLLALIKEHGDRQEDLAKAIGLSRGQLSRKIHAKNGASFNQPEIQAIRERYRLSDDQTMAVFFAKIVS